MKERIEKLQELTELAYEAIFFDDKPLIKRLKKQVKAALATINTRTDIRNIMDEIRSGNAGNMDLQLANEVTYLLTQDRSEYGELGCRKCTPDYTCPKHTDGRIQFTAQPVNVDCTHFAVNHLNSGESVCRKTKIARSTIHKDEVTCKDCLHITAKYERKFDVSALLFKVSPTLFS